MREIKFRVWDKERNKMRWECDNLLIGLDGYLFWNFGNTCNVIGGQKRHPEYILMQYTGLKDKNGKEIYEGDIVKFLESSWEVQFSNGAFILKRKDGDFQAIFQVYPWIEIEVIDNKYE